MVPRLITNENIVPSLNGCLVLPVENFVDGEILAGNKNTPYSILECK